MTRSAGIAVENSFVRGLITEATELNYPENSCTETFNCRFLRTGEVKRRLGINFEVSYAAFSLTGDATRSVSAVTEYLWLGAAGDGNYNFVVIQVGQYLYFYQAGSVLSANKNADSVDLSTHAVSGAANPYEHPCAFASGDGKLFVVGKHIEPFYVEYDPSTDTFSETSITVEVRDIQGDPDDPYAFNERPTATTSTVDIHHLYNLWNQGWAEDVQNHSSNQVNPVAYWDTQLTTIPSNHDRWWFFKDANEKYYPSDQVGIIPSSTGIAPKGHFIFNAFNIARTTAAKANGQTINTVYTRTDQNTLNDTTSGVYRPSAVAFFANRIWYAGVDASGYNNVLYFSQLLDDITKVGKCYQQNDPTDETFNDLLPTDGGTLVIPALSNVTKMMEVNNSLMIFATNGIWRITGSEGIGFTASDFSVTQVSSLQNRGRLSYVDVNGTPIWVNAQGVYTIGQQGVQSISEQTIQTFFDTIPKTSIPYIKGIYNQDDKCVYWLYKSESVGPVDRNYEYDRVLVLNTETGAFYPWTMGVSSARNVIGLAVVTGSSTETTVDNVIDSSSNTVVDSNTDQVVANTVTTVSLSPTTKFLVEYLDSGVRKLTWAEEFCTTYEDFNACTVGQGVDYSSYFISGYKTRGEAIRQQQATYMMLHSRAESGASVYVQGVWDYKTSSGTKRWSNPQQGYRHKSNSAFTTRKLKIRGNGLSLQIRCYSETNKPFNITGWAMLETAANAV